MRSPRFLYLSTVLLLFLCYPCAQAAEYTDHILAEGTPASAPKALWVDGHVLLAFYDADGLPMVWDPALPTAPHRVASQDPRIDRNSLLDLSGSADHVYLLWRPWVQRGEQAGEKRILFGLSRDGGKTFSAPLVLNTGGGAFHPRRLRQGGGGRLYLVWADERAKPDAIYFTRSGDHGRTWLSPELRVNAQAHGTGGAEPASLAYDPFMAVDGGKVWLGWSEIPPATPQAHRVRLRRSMDGGETWSTIGTVPVPEARIFNASLVRTSDGV
jgi:hypothetical protein